MVGLKGRSAIYGGQVIGQALVAALNTVDHTFHPHSLHCYFIKAGIHSINQEPWHCGECLRQFFSGNEKMPILYQVDRVRDGRSFATRFVKAIQDGESIFTAELSFHKVSHSELRSAHYPENVRVLSLLRKSRIRLATSGACLTWRSRKSWQQLGVLFISRL